jgi:predicted Zn-dependent peptidase
MSAEKDTAGMVTYFQNKHIEKVFELASQILFRPVFPEKEFSVLMKKRLRWYLVSREKIQNLATDRFFESVFGTHHPYGKKVSEKDYESVNTKQLREFHHNYYTPGNLTIIISGKIEKNTVELLEKYLGGLLQENFYNIDNVLNMSGEANRREHIKKRGTLQSSVRIGSSTINKRHPDYPGLKVLNSVLGGYFGSRLMKNIREEKGFTYGIHSSVTSLDLSGYKVISAEMSKKSTQKAIDEIYKEIRILQTEPVKYEELEVVRNYMAGEMVRMFDGPFAMAESFKAIWEFDLDVDYYDRLADTIRSITSEEIMQIANTYYKIDELYEIIAG